MGTQQADPPTDSTASLASLPGVLGLGAKQLFGQLTIAKAANRVFPAQRGLEQGLIVAP